MDTVRDRIGKAAARLSAGPHPQRADRDAELLLLHVLGWERSRLFAHPEYELTKEVGDAFETAIVRRLKGEPMQYITGVQEFYGRPFVVSAAVLIPRPETELLVELAVEEAHRLHAQAADKIRVLDIGTGSGAIAATLALELGFASVMASDISATALEVASRNADVLGAKVRFAQADLLGEFAGERFELIVSNPPYVPEVDLPELDVEVSGYEPATALFAGPDGLDVYRRLVPAAWAALVEGGSLLLEMGAGQHLAMQALLEEHGFGAIEFARDLQGIERVAKARKP